MSSGGDVDPPPAATAPKPPPTLPPTSRLPLDFRNGDLVSRLLAATPPYLYNMPLVPHSFFFSEMLRSFVQAKTGDVAGTAQQPMPAPRRSRKRSWRESKLQPPPLDKPLELTTTSRHAPLPAASPQDEKPPPPSPPTVIPPPPLMLPPPLIPPPGHDSSLLPPPPPIWYPPLYPLPPPQAPPPYGIDPLHFFIDLRVSGHIWDRKPGKDGDGSPQTGDEGPPLRPPRPSSLGPSSSALVKQSKHCSAFSVPQPRTSASEGRQLSPAPRNGGGTHYVLQNLSRIYQDVRSRANSAPEGRDVEASTASSEGGEEDGNAKPPCKDLRALIGLELVVDYVKHENGTPTPTSHHKDDDAALEDTSKTELL